MVTQSAIWQLAPMTVSAVLSSLFRLQPSLTHFDTHFADYLVFNNVPHHRRVFVQSSIFENH